MDTKYVVMLTAASLAAGALIQRQWDNKEIEKISTQVRTVIQDHIVTVTKTITKPDGSSETDSTTTDTSIKKEIEKSIAESSKPAYNPQWLISGGASLDLERTPAYQLQVQRAILGPVWVGIWGSTRKEAGINVGVLF